MRRRTVPQMLVGAGAVVLLATSLVGYIDSHSPGTGAGSRRNTVRIADFSYEPGSIEATVGARVTFSNSDDFSHTVTSRGGGPLDSGDIGADGTYQATFDAPGSYEYVCTIHPSMTGVVEVTSA